MEQNINALFAEKVGGFRLPRYRELPNMGLYLEQVTKYINGFLTPLGCPEITTSMISNYVKKGVVSAPVKKQYYAEQIAYLIFISFGKSVLSIENIRQLFCMQKEIYTAEIAYNYFCLEFENILRYIGGLSDSIEKIGSTHSEVKTMLRSSIMALAHIIFVNHAFDATTFK